ncbi:MULTISPECIES: plasmid partitioning protein RepB C-terminal domain-containing protein [unclassified Variovorax]|uniref:plasmid partitioning protein RepB C-terminal domain-containing protein n=1 Tax=unclassified Variovorax TaxID=663243 RepID=UPI003F459DC4
MNTDATPEQASTKATRTRTAFLKDCVVVPLQDLVYLKTLRPLVKESVAFLQIVASISEIGLVEPPAVFPDTSRKGRYFVMDGHLRIEALKQLGAKEVSCLIATDDDTYTYNKQLNKQTPVQAHKMIVAAIESGLPAERLAKTLNLSPSTIRNRFRMLDGICDEAAELLEDKLCPAKLFAILRRMKPVRQIEAAELMIGQNNFATVFADAMLLNTPPSLLVANTAANDDSVSVESMARLEREIAVLQSQVRAVEDSFGPDVLLLTVIKRFLSAWLDCAPVVRWLAENRPEYLKEFQSISEITQVSQSALSPEETERRSSKRA